MRVAAPPAVVTVTSTFWPSCPTGEMATMCPASATVNLTAGLEPKLTPVAPSNPLPLMVTF